MMKAFAIFALSTCCLLANISEAQSKNPKGAAIDGGSSKPRDHGENMYNLGCAAWGIAGHYGYTDIPACLEKGYNSEVKRLIDERKRFDMNGNGVIYPSPTNVETDKFFKDMN